MIKSKDHPNPRPQINYSNIDRMWKSTCVAARIFRISGNHIRWRNFFKRDEIWPSCPTNHVTNLWAYNWLKSKSVPLWTELRACAWWWLGIVGRGIVGSSDRGSGLGPVHANTYFYYAQHSGAPPCLVHRISMCWHSVSIYISNIPYIRRQST